jgi:hypothetical protein
MRLVELCNSSKAQSPSRQAGCLLILDETGGFRPRLAAVWPFMADSGCKKDAFKFLKKYLRLSIT